MRKYAACIVAIQDEFCLEETIIELQYQGLDKALIVSPKRYWTTGEPQDPKDLEALRTIAQQTGAEVVSVDLQGETPLKSEALYRNFGASYLQDCGYRHLVIVDADEFWSPDALEEIDDLVSHADIAYQLPFTPVIGVPGYPVIAKSYGLVYTPANTRLEWGRATPSAHGRGSSTVYHFSATRRTLEEVAAKSRRSAHYVEPEYAFDRWLRDVLPNVKPGQRDVHMYTQGPNIWPLVRHWTHTDLNRIPETLHGYLGKPA